MMVMVIDLMPLAGAELVVVVMVVTTRIVTVVVAEEQLIMLPLMVLLKWVRQERAMEAMKL